MVLHQRAKSEANLGLGIDGMKRDSRTSLLGHDVRRGSFGRHRKQSRHPLLQGHILTALAALVLLILAIALILQDGVKPNLDVLRRWQPAPVEQAVFQTQAQRKICPSCNCSDFGSYALSSKHGNLPSLDRIYSGKSTPSEMAQYLATNIYMRSQADPTPMGDDIRAQMLSHFLTCPDKLFSYSFDGIQLRRPTSYIFTRVGGGDRLGTTQLRLKYLQRHADTMKEYNSMVEKEGFMDGLAAKDRQLLWIVVEDDEGIDTKTAKWLANSGIPHLYFSWGPTRTIGLSQWRVVLRTIEFLREDLLADGPVYSLDADNYVKPELLKRIWQVEKVIVFQIGGFRTVYPAGIDSDWEGPFVEDGRIKHWQSGWRPERTFPIDMGGFAINSSVIGREVAGPYYVPYKEWTDIDTSNESEFLAQIYDDKSKAQLLCNDSVKDKCYFAWHNHWMEEEIAERGWPAPTAPDY